MYTSRILRSAMKNLRPIGIPHSIFLENLFAKTYDATKLDEDTERVREEYQNRGYFKVVVNDPKTEIHDTGHQGFHIPLIQAGPGKAVDITIPIDEGEKYRLGRITFKNNKAVTNVKALRSQFPIKDGDIFDRSKIAQGPGQPARCVRDLGLHQLHVDSQHQPLTKTRSWSSSPSTWTRASSSSCAASSSPATPPPATR